jgi:hypothetical protein
METLLAIISAVPKIIALFQLITGMVRDAEQRGIGRKEAVSDALATAHFDIASGDAAVMEAVSRHAKINDDTAFDPAFKRKD